MKRIFLGLVILVASFISALPWEDMYFGITSWGDGTKFWSVLAISIVVVAIFMIKTNIGERLTYPAPGLTLITIGIILSVGIWLTLITVVMTIISLLLPYGGLMLIVLLGFAVKFGVYIAIAELIAKALLLFGTFQLLSNLFSDEGEEVLIDDKSI